MKVDQNEEKILLRKAEDMLRRAEKSYKVIYSHFLNPAEQTVLAGEDAFYGVLSFYGGYPDAERRLACFLTSEFADDDGLPIILFEAKITDPEAEISHRDVLGTLMGLGIKREMIGDIMVQDTKAFFFCHQSVAEYLEINMKKIGRYRIELKQTNVETLPAPKMETITVNVSSMRLDSLCGECFGLSRTKAGELIEKGLVTVNWLVCDNKSREIKPEDKIAVRGKGKICIIGVTGTSKKGRLFVDVAKYI